MSLLRSRVLIVGVACALGHICLSSFGQTVQAVGTLTGLPQSSDTTAATHASDLSQSSLLTSVPEDFSKLKIAPGFLLNLTVYDAAELSGSFRVDDSGNVTLPLIGAIPVEGLTITEAQSRIQTTFLKEDMLRNPQVTLNIQQYAPFYVSVSGEVANAGKVQLMAPHSLLDVLTQAGGLTQLAGNVVQVKHLVNGVSQTETYHYSKGSNGDSIKGVIIQNGDTIIVPRAGIVYVLGAVTRPGGYIMQEDGKLNVAQAIALAQGATRDAKTGSTRVVRQNTDGSTLEFPVDYTAVSDGKQAPLQLQAQDIIYIPVSKAKAIFSNSASILSSTASATIYVLK